MPTIIKTKQNQPQNKTLKKHIHFITGYIWSHWVKLFFMNTFGKLALSSSTALLSIWEQKDTSSKERSLQDSRSFLKEAGLTILVPWHNYPNWGAGGLNRSSKCWAGLFALLLFDREQVVSGHTTWRCGWKPEVVVYHRRRDSSPVDLGTSQK